MKEKRLMIFAVIVVLMLVMLACEVSFKMGGNAGLILTCASCSKISCSVEIDWAVCRQSPSSVRLR